MGSYCGSESFGPVSGDKLSRCFVDGVVVTTLTGLFIIFAISRIVYMYVYSTSPSKMQAVDDGYMRLVTEADHAENGEGVQASEERHHKQEGDVAEFQQIIVQTNAELVQAEGNSLHRVAFVLMLALAALRAATLVGRLATDDEFWLQRYLVVSYATELTAWCLGASLVVIDRGRRQRFSHGLLLFMLIMVGVGGVRLYDLLQGIGGDRSMQWHQCLLLASFVLYCTGGLLAAIVYRQHVRGTVMDTARDATSLSIARSDRSTVRKLVSIGMVDAELLLLGMATSVLSSASNVLFTALQARVISALVASSKEDLLEAVMLMGAAAVVMSICALLQQVGITMCGLRIVLRMQRMTFNAIMEQDMSFFDEEGHETGELCSYIQSNTEHIKEGITNQFASAVTAVFTFLGVLIFILQLSWKLTLIFFALGFLPLALFIGFGAWEATLTKTLTDADAKQNSTATQHLRRHAFETTASFNNQQRSMQQYWDSSQESFSWSKYTMLIQALSTSTVMPSFMACLALTQYIGGNMAIDGDFDITVMVVFTDLGVQCIGQLAVFSMVGTSVGAAIGASQQIFDIIRRVPKVPFKGGLRPQCTKGRIVFENVEFAYPTMPDKVILANFNLDIAAGERVAFCGSSGSGKSTVFALLQRFYDPQKGQLRLDGVPVAKLDPQWLRGQIGCVMQEPVLFQGTILDNITFGMEYSMGEVQAAAIKAHCHGFIELKEKKYETALGQDGSGLSGGQKQRIAIARAILRNPLIMLLDEATSALDAESQIKVQDALAAAMEGRTTLMISHHGLSSMHVNTVVVMDKGCVVEAGPYETLADDPKSAFAKLLSAPQRESLPALSGLHEVEDVVAVLESLMDELPAELKTKVMTQLRATPAVAPPASVGHNSLADFTRMENQPAWRTRSASETARNSFTSM